MFPKMKYMYFMNKRKQTFVFCNSPKSWFQPVAVSCIESSRTRITESCLFLKTASLLVSSLRLLRVMLEEIFFSLHFLWCASCTWFLKMMTPERGLSFYGLRNTAVKIHQRTSVCQDVGKHFIKKLNYIFWLDLRGWMNPLRASDTLTFEHGFNLNTIIRLVF